MSSRATLIRQNPFHFLSLCGHRSAICPLQKNWKAIRVFFQFRGPGEVIRFSFGDLGKSYVLVSGTSGSHTFQFREPGEVIRFSFGNLGKSYVLVSGPWGSHTFQFREPREVIRFSFGNLGKSYVLELSYRPFRKKSSLLFLSRSLCGQQAVRVCICAKLVSFGDFRLILISVSLRHTGQSVQWLHWAHL